MFRIANDARFWDRIARKYAADPIADMEGYERTLECSRHYLKGDEIDFEFGCGTGTTALKLAPSVKRIVATDLSSEMIAIARAKAEAEGCINASFEIATPDAAPWPDGTFDVAFGFNILHLVAAREAALKGIHRLLKPGGLFISKTPCLKEMNPLVRVALPIMQLIGKAPYVAFLSAEDLEREIMATGFELIERARHASHGKDTRPFLVAKRVKTHLLDDRRAQPKALTSENRRASWSDRSP
jgi:ubiquinone/menaquinone biosynthesis C-methylase UbiE